METVSIQIPAELYTAIYARYEETTSTTINECLQSLLVDNESQSVATGVEHFMRPGKDTITGRVWEIADQLFKDTGMMDRTAVVTACIKEDINMNTASTQFSHWKNATKEQQS